MNLIQKIVLIIVAPLLFAGLAAAQVPGGNVFFGYSYYNTDLSSIDRANTNGWEASVEGKVVPFLGFVADVDSHYGSQNFPICPVVPPGGGGSGCSSFNADAPSATFCLDRESRSPSESFVPS